MRQRIVFLLAMLFFLSFSSIVSASGSWESTIFPNMTKTLTEEEAAKALSLYGGTGSLGLHEKTEAYGIKESP